MSNLTPTTTPSKVPLPLSLRSSRSDFSHSSRSSPSSGRLTSSPRKPNQLYRPPLNDFASDVSVQQESPSRLAAKYKNWAPQHLSAHIKSSLTFAFSEDHPFSDESIDNTARWVLGERLGGRAFFELAEEDIEELSLPDTWKAILLYTWQDLHQLPKTGIPRVTQDTTRSPIPFRSPISPAPPYQEEEVDVFGPIKKVQPYKSPLHTRWDSNITQNSDVTLIDYRTDSATNLRRSPSPVTEETGYDRETATPRTVSGPKATSRSPPVRTYGLTADDVAERSHHLESEADEPSVDQEYGEAIGDPETPISERITESGRAGTGTQTDVHNVEEHIDDRPTQNDDPRGDVAFESDTRSPYRVPSVENFLAASTSRRSPTYSTPRNRLVRSPLYSEERQRPRDTAIRSEPRNFPVRYDLLPDEGRSSRLEDVLESSVRAISSLSKRVDDLEQDVTRLEGLFDSTKLETVEEEEDQRRPWHQSLTPYAVLTGWFIAMGAAHIARSRAGT